MDETAERLIRELALARFWLSGWLRASEDRYNPMAPVIHARLKLAAQRVIECTHY